MKCPHCGNDQSPERAHFCLKCGGRLDPGAVPVTGDLVFPGLFDVRSWLEGKKKQNGFFGRPRRAFGICFSVMLAPKQAVAIDGTLRVVLSGIRDEADLNLQLPVRKDDFAMRRFDLMTTSYNSLCYIDRHPHPLIPAPVNNGCKLELTLTAESGAIYTASQNILFNDREPGTGPPPPKLWE